MVGTKGPAKKSDLRLKPVLPRRTGHPVTAPYRVRQPRRIQPRLWINARRSRIARRTGAPAHRRTGAPAHRPTDRNLVTPDVDHERASNDLDLGTTCTNVGCLPPSTGC